MRSIERAVELTWVGHGTVLIETGGQRLLTDPVLGRRTAVLRRLVPAPGPEVAEGIDAVLLSHLHADHADVASLRRVGSAVPVVAPPGARDWLVRHGFDAAQELEAGASATLADGLMVQATRAIHDTRRWGRRGAAGAVGFLVGRDPSIYFAGDTDLFPEMAELAGRVDVALVPVWGWGSAAGVGHLDPERAARAVAMIRPALAIPIHWGTLGLPWKRPGRDQRAEPALAFAAKTATLAPDVEVRVLDPGGKTTVG